MLRRTDTSASAIGTQYHALPHVYHLGESSLAIHEHKNLAFLFDRSITYCDLDHLVNFPFENQRLSAQQVTLE